MAKILTQGKERFMCPVCENERIEPGQKYCQICGEPLEWVEDKQVRFVEANKTIGKDINVLPKWIPVEERLPEPNARVLVTLKHHRWITDYGSAWVPEDEKIDHQEYTEVCEAVYMPDIGWKYAEAEADYGEAFAFVKPEKDMSCPVVEVTAWMPLPEPYQGEKEN